MNVAYWKRQAEANAYERDEALAEIARHHTDFAAIRRIVTRFFEWYDDEEADLIEATQEAPSYLAEIRRIVG